MRHAYLIITHGSFPILEKQLLFLDSENADFFIHVDKKVASFDFDRFSALPRRSHVTFTERFDISWGDFSMVEAELALLKAASAAGKYDYYHLLSGVDVPVKSRSCIESYFARTPGRNYLNFQSETISRADLRRVRYYYPFQKTNIRKRWLRLGLQQLTWLVQSPFVNRLRRSELTFRKGAQWFSLTDEFVRYVLSREDSVRRAFTGSFCSDEMVMHTLMASSPYLDTLPENAFRDDYRSCCRYIDWNRGRPYCFRNGDYEELISLGEDYLFARKFDYRTDPDVVDRLFAHFGEPAENTSAPG